MGKSGKIRIIIWGTLAFICLVLGSLGYYQVYSENKISDAEKSTLKSIASIFVDSSDFASLKETGIKIEAELKKNAIEVNYIAETFNNIYKFEYDKKYRILKFKCSSSDVLVLTMIKNMLDAISVYNGNNKDVASKIFSSIERLNEYTINDGFTYTEENGNIIAELSISNPLRKIEGNSSFEEIDDKDDFEEELKNAKYFVVDDLIDYKDDFINGTFSKTKNNVKIVSSREDNKIHVSIVETGGLTETAFNSMKNVILTLINENIYYNFINNYKSFDDGNKTIDGISVEINPIIEDYEYNSISSNDKFIRITFNTSILKNE